MSSPVTAKQMRLSISANGSVYTVAVVEMTNIELLREGGVEHRYGLRGTQSDNRHKVGMKRAKFTIRRWFKSDPNQGKVLFNIHDNSIEFTLREYVKDSSGFVGLVMDGCVSYNYRLITGTANDIISEEISGEGTVWEKQISLIPTGECLSWLENNGVMATTDQIDIVTPVGGQRILIIGKHICRVYFKLSMAPTGDNWIVSAQIRRVSDDSVIQQSPTVCLDEDLPLFPNFVWFGFEFDCSVNEEVRVVLSGSFVNGAVILWVTTPLISGMYTHWKPISGYVDYPSYDTNIKIYVQS